MADYLCPSEKGIDQVESINDVSWIVKQLRNLLEAILRCLTIAAVDSSWLTTTTLENGVKLPC